MAQKAATVAISLATVGAFGIMTAPSASAATGYNGACGSGYKVVNELTDRLTRYYLTYNSSNGTNCVVAVYQNIGPKPVEMVATIIVNHVQKADMGPYSSYAGPVYLKGAGFCVTWGGRVTYSNGETISTGASNTNCG
ncbi:spore-associated protein A [Streptomyces sp. NPDC056491]|uniref:spore-associated protein A n=1 Tax=Streptomyces sp. NPDC056491 TaxID=3345837 RepID=UPI0036921901